MIPKCMRRPITGGEEKGTYKDKWEFLESCPQWRRSLERGERTRETNPREGQTRVSWNT